MAMKFFSSLTHNFMFSEMGDAEIKNYSNWVWCSAEQSLITQYKNFDLEVSVRNGRLYSER